MKKLTIIGTGYGWENAPHGDDLEVWGITYLPTLRKDVNNVIDMNVYDDLRWGRFEQERNERVIDWCEENDVPYICLDNYPIDEIEKHFCVDYFSNTVDYALALGIYKGFKEIHLYGVNVTHDSEYAYQKPGIDFWCGVAIGRGIKVVIPGKKSAIMKTSDGLMYGYDRKQKQQLSRRLLKRIDFDKNPFISIPVENDDG